MAPISCSLVHLSLPLLRYSPLFHFAGPLCLLGTEKFIDNLIAMMDTNPAFFLSAVRCLPMAPTARAAVSAVLQACRPKVRESWYKNIYAYICI